MTINEIQHEIIEEFSVYEDWMDKYGYLIELGNELKDLDPKDKTDQFLIRGCQSRVWLISDFVDGKIVFRVVVAAGGGLAQRPHDQGEYKYEVLWFHWFAL